MPEKRDRASPASRPNTRHSHVSGGGGERDIHHSHDPALKRDFQENSEQRRKP